MLTVHSVYTCAILVVRTNNFWIVYVFKWLCSRFTFHLSGCVASYQWLGRRFYKYRATEKNYRCEWFCGGTQYVIYWAMAMQFFDSSAMFLCYWSFPARIQMWECRWYNRRAGGIAGTGRSTERVVSGNVYFRYVAANCGVESHNCMTARLFSCPLGQ